MKRIEHLTLDELRARIFWLGVTKLVLTIAMWTAILWMVYGFSVFQGWIKPLPTTEPVRVESR
jgi:hypothetical protein